MLRFEVSVHGDKAGPLAVTFDDAFFALQQLDRLFIEPDGSFVWAGETDAQQWQVDGNLIDRGDVLAYVEVKGACPDERFNRFLTTLGWPGATIVFQLSRQGSFVDESAFRQMAASATGAI
jgi:hypothetical protein